MPAERDKREFAVLVPLVSEGGENRILLIQRPERPEDAYSGQICLPGGAREPEDTSLEACALRETREELGVDPSRIEIFAEIGWRRSSIHHRVKPFAGWVRAGAPIVPNRDEVEDVLYLPAHRLRPELFELRGTRRDASGREAALYRFDLDGREVWGLTARILRDFLLECPRFAAAVSRAKG